MNLFEDDDDSEEENDTNPLSQKVADMMKAREGGN